MSVSKPFFTVTQCCCPRGKSLSLFSRTNLQVFGLPSPCPRTLSLDNITGTYIAQCVGFIDTYGTITLTTKYQIITHGVVHRWHKKSGPSDLKLLITDTGIYWYNLEIIVLHLLNVIRRTIVPRDDISILLYTVEQVRREIADRYVVCLVLLIFVTQWFFGPPLFSQSLASDCRT